MTGREKIDAAVAYLEGRGVSMNGAAPAHYRFVWALGVHVPPPHFQTFLGLFLFNAIFVGVVLSGMALAFERHHHAIRLMLTVGPPGGILVGLIIAPVYRLKAWRLGLPRWSEFPRDRATEDDAGW